MCSSLMPGALTSRPTNFETKLFELPDQSLMLVYRGVEVDLQRGLEKKARLPAPVGSGSFGVVVRVKPVERIENEASVY